MTKQTLFFSLPPEIEAATACAVIDSLPNNWSWVDGSMTAPAPLIASGEAVKDAGLMFGYYGTVAPVFVGERPDGKYREPDMHALYVDGRLPQTVLMQYAGLHHGMVTIKLAKAIAVKYIGFGYTGWLAACQGYNDDCLEESICARFKICWGGVPTPGKPPKYPLAYVAIRTSNEYAPSQLGTDIIIAKCRSLELTEFQTEYEL